MGAPLSKRPVANGSGDESKSAGRKGTSGHIIATAGGADVEGHSKLVHVEVQKREAVIGAWRIAGERPEVAH